MDLELVGQPVRAQSLRGRGAGRAIPFQDVAAAVWFPWEDGQESGRDERLDGARGIPVRFAIPLCRVLDRAQVALDVQRVDAVLPLPARALLVRLREHRFGERGRHLQLSA